jgi:hypothetical protein
VTAKFATLLALAGAVALSASCGDFVRQGRSPVMLVVDSLQDKDGNHTLRSDVLTSTGTFNDLATASLRILLKDQGSLGVSATPSELNQVVIDRYRVEYVRADGHNVPGVDVPFSFDSALTQLVTADGDEAIFQIVRHSAKEEAPLAALRLTGTGHFISTIATVTFYGHDLAGNDISASGHIGIDFADFADEN